MKIPAESALAGLAPIAAVERDTGLSKELLRTWERRYGFPSPKRDETGDRRYGSEEIEKLRLIKRLIDIGRRPRQLVALSVGELALLTRESAPGAPACLAPSRELGVCLSAIKGHHIETLRSALQDRLLESGLSSFVREFLAPLTALVGQSWSRGEIDIAQEHLYSRAVESVLHGALHVLSSAPRTPSLVLATVPGEEHALGLLMAETLFTLARATCLCLGVEAPIGEIDRAARARRADVVALSFSTVLAGSLVRRGVTELRAVLPANCEIWIGGANAALAQCVRPGVTQVTSLEAIAATVDAWRERHASRVPTFA
jgi:hypothetical protein